MKVNGKGITASQFSSLLWDWGYDAVAHDVAAYISLLQEAQKAGITASETEINAAYQKKKQDIVKTLPVGKTFEQALAAQQFTSSKLYLSVKAELLLNKLSDVGFDPKSYVKVATIIFKPVNEQSPALIEAIRRADDALARLKKGEAWATVLKGATTDPNVLKADGSIGWKNFSAFPKSVATELGKLKPGEYTTPAQTASGIQIFKLEASGTSAKAGELEELRKGYRAMRQREVLMKLQKDTKIEYTWATPLKG
ncbi:MAG: peptidylprolyl isomerase [Armatimonadetes bacterium]|nr:peptidylprolyl isomerase [Armatimonadota bacterium]